MSTERMTILIRPTLRGFHLEQNGKDARHFPRLIEAIIEAARLTQFDGGEIQIINTSGEVAETLQMP